MRFVLRTGSGPTARADIAMLTALGLPGGGMLEVGDAFVRVVPGDVRVANELHVPASAFDNGAGRPGATVDAKRVVVPKATHCTLARGGSTLEAVPSELVGIPAKSGDRFPTANGTVIVSNIAPSPSTLVAETVARDRFDSTPRSKEAPPAEQVRHSGSSPLIVGLDDELDLLTGWLRLITGDALPGTHPGAGVVVTGPSGSGRRDLIEASAANSGLRTVPVDLRTVTTAERLLLTLEKAVSNVAPGSVLVIDRLDPLVERQGGVSSQAAAVTRWLLDSVADRAGVAVVITTSLGDLVDRIDASDLLRRTLTITPPDHARRRALLEAVLADRPDLDFDTLTNATAGFSAHDIQTAVLDARAVADATLTTDGVLDAIRDTTPSLGTASLGSIPTYGFDKVANLTGVKQALTESVIWQLTEPERFKRMGIEPPRGLLLYGPPGTGKTFVVRALAHESGAAFFSIKGAELLDKWVGESERGVREVFARARSVAPSIIFFDEIDALAPVRGSSTNSVTDSVVAALLTELDGVGGRGDVFVIGATNRKDLVDPALLRPGRFEVHLLLDLPAPESRRAFLDITDVPLSNDVDMDQLVDDTEAMSFADLEGLLRAAAISAMRRDSHAAEVTRSDIDEALGSG